MFDVFPGVMTSCQDLTRHDIHLHDCYEFSPHSERELSADGSTQRKNVQHTIFTMELFYN